MAIKASALYQSRRVGRRSKIAAIWRTPMRSDWSVGALTMRRMRRIRGFAGDTWWNRGRFPAATSSRSTTRSIRTGRVLRSTWSNRLMFSRSSWLRRGDRCSSRSSLAHLWSLTGCDRAWLGSSLQRRCWSRHWNGRSRRWSGSSFLLVFLIVTFGSSTGSSSSLFFFASLFLVLIIDTSRNVC